MTATDKPFANFTPGEHRQLLADINRWRRVQGWTRDARGVHVPLSREFGIDVCDGADGSDWFGFRVMRGALLHKPTDYPANSVRQAVDLLTVLDVLPPAFCSLYKLGRRDGEWIVKGWTDETQRLKDELAAAEEQIASMRAALDDADAEDGTR